MSRKQLLGMCVLFLLLLSFAGSIGCGTGNWGDTAAPIRGVKYNYGKDASGHPLPPGVREKITTRDHYSKGTPPGPHGSTDTYEYEIMDPKTGQWVPKPGSGVRSVPVAVPNPPPPLLLEGSRKSTKAIDMLGGGSGGSDGGGAGAGGGGHCFAAGTQVLMADGALQDIAALKAGDQLQSRDPQSGDFRPVAVEKVYQAAQPEHYLINGTLRVTGTHPFMLEQGATRSAAELRPGDVVQGREGAVTIKSVERIAAESEVFNLTVTDTHTFFVSGGDKDIYWVHNK